MSVSCLVLWAVLASPLASPEALPEQPPEQPPPPLEAPRAAPAITEATIDALLAKALEAFNRGRVDEGVESLRQTLALAEQAGLYRRACELNLELAEIMLDSGNWQTAEELFARAIPLATRAGEPVMEAIAHLGLSRIYRRLQLTDDALRTVARAITVARQIGDETLEANGMFEMAAVCTESGRLPEARALLEKAIAIYERIGGKPAAAQARHDLAYVYREMGDRDTAEKLLNEIFPFVGADDMGAVRARALRLRAVLAVDRMAWDDAEADLREAATVAERIGEIEFAIGCGTALAELYIQRGRFDDASPLIARQIEYYTRAQHPLQLTSAYINLVTVRLGQGQTTAAVAAALRSLDFARQTGLAEEVERARNNVNWAESKRVAQPPATAHALRDAAADAVRQDDHATASLLQLELSRRLATEKRYEDAVAAAEQAAAVAREIGSVQLLVRSLQQLQSLQGEQGKTAAQRSRLAELYDIAVAAQEWGVASDAAELLAKLADDQGDRGAAATWRQRRHDVQNAQRVYAPDDLVAQGQALMAEGRNVEAEEPLRLALRRATDAGAQPAELTRIRCALGRLLMLTGRQAEARQHLQAALAATPASTNAGDHVSILWDIANTYIEEGQPQKAYAEIEAAESTISGLFTTDQRFRARVFAADLATRINRSTDAARWLAAAEPDLGASADMGNAAYFHWVSWRVAKMTGAGLDAEEAHLVQAVEHGRASNDTNFPLYLRTLMQVHGQRGKLGDLVTSFGELVRLHRERNETVDAAEVIGDYGYGLITCGRYQDARIHLEQSIEMRKERLQLDEHRLANLALSYVNLSNVCVKLRDMSGYVAARKQAAALYRQIGEEEKAKSLGVPSE